MTKRHVDSGEVCVEDHTEKRYKRLVSSIDYYYCIDTNDDKGLTEEDMLNRLNEQDKEIQKLKQKVNGLKSELTIWKEDANEHIKEINKLFEENKQLKQTIRDVYGILCIDVDVFSDKATEHDINAYVLIELDNKDAYYMAKGTKKAIELLKKVIK